MPKKGKMPKNTRGSPRRKAKLLGGSMWTGSENSIIFIGVLSFCMMIMYRLSISPDKEGVVDYKSIQGSRQYVVYAHAILLIFIALCMKMGWFEGKMSVVAIVICTLVSLACFIMWFKYGMDVPINPACSIDKDGLITDKDGEKRNLNASSFFFIESVPFYKQGFWIAVIGVVLCGGYLLYQQNKEHLQKKLGEYTSLEGRETKRNEAKKQRKEADAAEKKRIEAEAETDQLSDMLDENLPTVPNTPPTPS